MSREENLIEDVFDGGIITRGEAEEFMDIQEDESTGHDLLSVPTQPKEEDAAQDQDTEPKNKRHLRASFLEQEVEIPVPQRQSWRFFF